MARAKIRKKPVEIDSLKQKYYLLSLELSNPDTYSKQPDKIDMILVDTSSSVNDTILGLREVPCLINNSNTRLSQDTLYYCGRIFVDTFYLDRTRYVMGFSGKDIRPSSGIGVEFEDFLDCGNIVCTDN